MKKWIGIILVVLISVYIVSVGLYHSYKVDLNQPQPVNGILDLSNWSFEEDGSVKLDGGWQFYYKQFLTHEDFMKRTNISPVMLTIPSTKASIDSNKGIPSDKFYGTMRLVVKLPDRNQIYGLRSDIVLTSFRLFIDDVFLGESGKVGRDRDSSEPKYTVNYSYISPKSNEIEIIYHVSDHYVGDGVIVSPRLGLASQMSSLAQKKLGQDMFLFGMLLIMGIYHLVLFILRTNDKAPLYYGIFCISFSLRMLLVGERYLPVQYNIDFFTYAKIAYICVFIGSSALCGFLYYALEGLFIKAFNRICMAFGIVFSVLILFVPYQLYDKLLIIYVIFGLFSMIYVFTRLIQGVWNNVPFTNVVLIGFICLVITFVNDLIYQITVANKAAMIPIGVSLFTLTQTYTLSARFSKAFTKVEHLSTENEIILTELKDVNSNLESIVETRTADLQNALDEMDLMSKTDYLTKLPNRRYIVQKIEKLIQENEFFYIAILDVDHFKELNDSLGHVKGDQVLQKMSEIMVKTIGNQGLVGRWGGEEFLILLVTDQARNALTKANEIRKNIELNTAVNNGVAVTVTIGLCPYSESYKLDTCIANADKALYLGKLNGRNQCRLFEG